MTPKLELRHALYLLRETANEYRRIAILLNCAIEKADTGAEIRNPVELQETLEQVATLLHAIRLMAAHHEANLVECLESYMEATP